MFPAQLPCQHAMDVQTGPVQRPPNPYTCLIAVINVDVCMTLQQSEVSRRPPCFMPNFPVNMLPMYVAPPPMVAGLPAFATHIVIVVAFLSILNLLPDLSVCLNYSARFGSFTF